MNGGPATHPGSEPPPSCASPSSNLPGEGMSGGGSLPDDADRLAMALDYARHGAPVLPLHYPIPDGQGGLRCSCDEAKCKPAKHPDGRLAPHGLNDASADAGLVRQWWSKSPQANIGLRTGFVFDVVDIDGAKGEATWAELERQHGPMLSPVEVRTSKGRHLYFAPGGLSNVTGDDDKGLGPGIDARGKGSYVLAPPSTHISGAAYQWGAGGPELWAELPNLPESVVNLSHRKSRAKRETYSEGDRNDGLFRELCGLRREGQTFDELLSEAEALNEAKCDPPLEAHEVLQTVQSALKYAPPNPLIADRWTDDGCARRLAAFAGHRLRYVYPWRTWLAWDGTRWARCDAGEQVHVARELVATLLDLAKDIADDKFRQEFYAAAIGLEGEARRRRMFEAAQSLLAVAPDELDADTWLLNCQNGVLDLRTGKLLPHDPVRLITKIVPVDYDPDAECLLFLEFLSRIMGGNAALVDFLQRAIGYTLTGETSERKLFLLHGQGRNGKSTLLEIARDLAGDYARATGFDTFAHASHANPGGALPELVRLMGTRFVSASEAERGRSLSTEVIKQVTGQDTIVARALYEAPVEFRPLFKLWLAANYRPAITDTTDSIWDRLCLIPFQVRIPEAEVDKDLLTKLRAELPGILAWAVRGCLDWQRDGLDVPDEVRAATQGYREEEDSVARFLSQCTVEPQTDGGIPTTAHTDLVAAYEGWCQATGETALGSRRLAQELRQKQIGERKPGNRVTWELQLRDELRF